MCGLELAQGLKPSPYKQKDLNFLASQLQFAGSWACSVLKAKACPGGPAGEPLENSWCFKKSEIACFVLGLSSWLFVRPEYRDGKFRPVQTAELVQSQPGRLSEIPSQKKKKEELARWLS